MMQLVPFRAEHLGQFEPGERERPLMSAVDVRAVARAWEGKAMALVEGETVLGIGGADAVPDGYVITLALSDALRARPMLLHRMARRVLRDTLSRPGRRRILAHVHPEDHSGIAWVERLGFAFDTEQANYAGTGETYWRYAA